MVLEQSRDRANYELVVQADGTRDVLSVAEIKQGLDFVFRQMEEAEGLPRLPGSGLPPAHTLVVSKDGCRRAGTIAAAYLLKKEKLTIEQAVSKIRGQRDCFNPSHDMLDNLVPFEEVEPDAPEGDGLVDPEGDPNARFHEVWRDRMGTPKRPVKKSNTTSLTSTYHLFPPYEERKISTRVLETMAAAAAAETGSGGNSEGGNAESSKSITPKGSAQENLAYMKKCGMIHDAFYFYGDLEPLSGGNALFNVRSAMDCCRICDEHPECYKWSYGLAGSERRKCYLKRELDGYVGERPHFLSGKATVRTAGSGLGANMGEL
eukprot:g12998.t1